MVAAAAMLLALPEHAQALAGRLGEPGVWSTLMEALIKLVLTLVPAGIVQWILSRILERRGRRAAALAVPGVWNRLGHGLVRFFLRLLPIVVFGVVAYVVLTFLEPRPATRVLALAIINATVLTCVIVAAARLVLAPDTPSLRLLRLSDETANYEMVWVRRLTVTAVYGYFALEALVAVGADPAFNGVVGRLLGLLLAAMAVILVMQNRVAVADWMRQGRELGGIGRIRRVFADVWHIVAIAAIAAFLAVAVLGIEGGFRFLLRSLIVSAAVLLVGRVVTSLLNQGMRRLFALSHELKDDFPGLEARANRYFPVLQGAVRLGVGIVVVIVLLQVWGVPAFAWLGTPTGRSIVGAVVTIALILLVALVLSELVSSLIARYLSRSSRGGGPAARSARMRTLLPLLRNAFRIVLGVMVALIVLSQLGLDIAPLLAGAGVVGLAIGFGAQTLVQDLITGMFILAEDTVSVGDVADVGDGHAGVVEAMSIRSIRLRDGAGTVHTVPFSSVKIVQNLTKDFSYAVLDLRIAYREDVDAMIALMKEIGARLQEDPALAAVILEPIEIIGLDSFAESSVVVKARMKTKPINQWTVMREFNRLLKQEIDRRGISIPFPHRTLVFHADRTGHATPVRVLLEGEAGSEGEGAETQSDSDSRSGREAEPNPESSPAPSSDSKASTLSASSTRRATS
jgi:small conductance mechanosensitive channel